MNIDVSTYKDENGKTLMYASPSNLSPASEEYEALVKERGEKLREAPPDMDDMTEDEVREIIKKCTDGKFLGVFGEETVNVLKVNLMLDGIL